MRTRLGGELERVPDPTITASLAGVRSRDVTFEFLNRLRLARDNPLHQIADRDHADDDVVLQHRKVTKTMFGHDGHALIHRMTRVYKHNGAGHDGADRSLFRRMPPQDYFSSVIALGNDAQEPILGNHKHG